MNEFEQRLRQVPLKPVPPEWRAEILAAAGQLTPDCSGPAPLSWRARWLAGWHSLFWPHPRAWAGLAVVWVVIAGLHVSQSDDAPVVEQSAASTPERLADLRQQQQMLVELLGANRASEAEPPKRSGAHTQRVRMIG